MRIIKFKGADLNLSLSHYLLSKNSNDGVILPKIRNFVYSAWHEILSLNENFELTNFVKVKLILKLNEAKQNEIRKYIWCFFNEALVWIFLFRFYRR